MIDLLSKYPAPCPSISAAKPSQAILRPISSSAPRIAEQHEQHDRDEHEFFLGSQAKPTTRDLVSSGLGRVKQQATAVASTVSPNLLPGNLTKMSAGELVAAGLGRVRSEAAAAVATSEGAALAAALVIGGAVGVYFLLPATAASAPAAAGAMMKAPGAAGFVVSRVAFLANKQLYFKVLHAAGAAAAVAVLA